MAMPLIFTLGVGLLKGQITWVMAMPLIYLYWVLAINLLPDFVQTLAVDIFLCQMVC